MENPYPLPDAIKAGFVALRAACHAQGLQSAGQAQQALASSASNVLLLRLGRLACLLGSAAGASSAAPATLSLQAFARASFQQAMRRSAMRRRVLASLPVDARHQWRISLKKLRHVCDTLLPVIAGAGQHRRWRACLSPLLDLLGGLNDAASGLARLRTLCPPEGSMVLACALTAGMLEGRGQAMRADLEAARRELGRCIRKSRQKETNKPWK